MLRLSDKSVMSDHKNRPSQLAAYGDLFFRLLDSAILLDSESFEVVDVNDAFERMMGRQFAQVLGKPVFEYVLPEQQDEFRKMLRIVRRRYYAQTWENRWILADGGVIDAMLVASMLKLTDGSEKIQLLVRDVTHERRAEQEIKQYIKKLQAANRRLESLSITDELTQLPNVRNFRERLSIEHSRADRYGSTYALIFIDADHFKNYNDRNGHPAGDEVLRQIANVLKRSCRVMDLPARYGGEEFVVLCPETDTSKAAVVAERVRKAVENRPFEHGGSQPLGKVTVSVGVASFPTDGRTSEEVLQAADSALYSAKHAGRNRVCIADASVSGKKAS